MRGIVLGLATKDPRLAMALGLIPEEKVSDIPERYWKKFEDHVNKEREKEIFTKLNLTEEIPHKEEDLEIIPNSTHTVGKSFKYVPRPKLYKDRFHRELEEESNFVNSVGQEVLEEQGNVAYAKLINNLWNKSKNREAAKR
jgi:hypothetical protein